MVVVGFLIENKLKMTQLHCPQCFMVQKKLIDVPYKCNQVNLCCNIVIHFREFSEMAVEKMNG